MPIKSIVEVLKNKEVVTHKNTKGQKLKQGHLLS